MIVCALTTFFDSFPPVESLPSSRAMLCWIENGELKIENALSRDKNECLIVILEVFSCLEPCSELIQPSKRVCNLAQNWFDLPNVFGSLLRFDSDFPKFREACSEMIQPSKRMWNLAQDWFDLPNVFGSLLRIDSAFQTHLEGCSGLIQGFLILGKHAQDWFEVSQF